MDSLEYKTLSNCYPDLVTCIGQFPNDIADRLRSSGILAPGDVKFLRNPNNCNDDKARIIVDVVLNQVQNDQQVYHELIKAMRTSGTWTKPALCKIFEEGLKSLLQVNTKQYSPEDQGN